jgi:hypothetical protein
MTYDQHKIKRGNFHGYEDVCTSIWMHHILKNYKRHCLEEQYNGSVILVLRSQTEIQIYVPQNK